MKRKMIMALCSVLILCTLTGCQLAKENAGTNVYEDRLVGIFVTTEYLDLFDFDGYLNDNLGSFQGGEVTIDTNTQNYQGRLYATLTTKTLTDEETGEIIETEEYVFDGVEGIPYFSVTVPATPERDSYHTSMSDDAISDRYTSLNYGDDINSTTLEGTIYVSPTDVELVYYFNPVYQSADGRVYVTTGNGFMVNHESDSVGSVYTQTLDATTTVTENGKDKTESMSIKLSISIMFAPEKITILQMDKDNRLLSRTAYLPGEMPQTFEPESDADYLIVETHKRNAEDSATITREIYSRDAENMETFFVKADGICVKRSTQMMW